LWQPNSELEVNLVETMKSVLRPHLLHAKYGLAMQVPSLKYMYVDNDEF
jgi:hypothetical protein